MPYKRVIFVNVGLHCEICIFINCSSIIFQSVAVEIQTSDPDEVTEDYIRDELAKAGGANYGTGVRAETDE